MKTKIFISISMVALTSFAAGFYAATVLITQAFHDAAR